MLGKTSSTSFVAAPFVKSVDSFYQNTKIATNVLRAASKSPSRWFNAVFTVTSSTARLLSGDPIAPIGMYTGGRDIVNMVRGEQSQTDLQRALSDVEADADMIQTLTETQKGHYEIIGNNLDTIQENVSGLYDKLEAIQKLSSQGVKDLQVQKEAACKLTTRAIDAYAIARDLFADAQRLSKHSQSIFGKCSGLSLKIIEVLKDDDIAVKDKIPLLEKMSKQIVASCESGKDKLALADATFLEAFTAFDEANRLEKQAVEETAKAVQHAEDVLKKAEEMAQHTKECQEKIAATQKELDKAKEGIDDILSLLDSLRNDIATAREEGDKLWGTGSVLGGIGTTAVVATAGLGIVGSTGAGVFVATGLHYHKDIAASMRYVYNYVIGRPPEAPRPFQLGGGECTVRLDERSSGVWNDYIMDRPSFTVGDFVANVGSNKLFRCRINLKDKNFPIAKEDLVRLSKILLDKLQDKTLSPAHCLGLLDRMGKGVKVIDAFGTTTYVKLFQKKMNGIVKLIKNRCADLISA
ncbi:MAG TPA: hypothetical protein VGJ00_00545 [Rhabdochlamydiaceae bacterium]|jgi:hypothetical protein